MLCELRIKNFALIDELKIEFGKGLNILSGETGAGKSILIGALSFVLGEKADPNCIRSGAQMTSVEGFFDLTAHHELLLFFEEQGIETSEKVLLLKREFFQGGRNRCYINGGAVTLTTLKKVGDEILDIHGQHEHQSLLNPEKHIDSLDGFGNFSKNRDRVRELFFEYERISKRLEYLRQEERALREKRSLYEFQVDEIDKAKLNLGEEESLENERLILENSEKLYSLGEESYDILYQGEDSILERLACLKEKLADVAEIDERMAGARESCTSLIYQLEDLARNLYSYKEKLSFDPQRLEEVRERLDLLRRLKKKYGGTIAAVLEEKERMKRELLSLAENVEELKELEKKKEIVAQDLHQATQELSNLRKRKIPELEEKVKEELKHLGMEKALFQVKIESEERFLNPKGIDKVEFLLSPNPGEDLKPLAKIASGGELSRLMLALKKILAEVDRVPTLIFDEIDVGIGGKVAESVGAKLKRIAKNRQILCVTHLPQIASFADFHYEVRKEVKGGRTLTKVSLLSSSERIQELARMLGGRKITPLALKHAKEMWKEAKRRED